MHAHDRPGDQDAIRSPANLALWTLAWLVTLALARFGPVHLWDQQRIVSWIALAANLAVGIRWMVAHARFLRGVDELQRKIMVDALAVALGVGLVGGFASAAANEAELVAFDATIAFFYPLMGIVYVVAVVVGTLRYR